MALEELRTRLDDLLARSRGDLDLTDLREDPAAGGAVRAFLDTVPLGPVVLRAATISADGDGLRLAGRMTAGWTLPALSAGVHVKTDREALWRFAPGPVADAAFFSAELRAEFVMGPAKSPAALKYAAGRWSVHPEVSAPVGLAEFAASWGLPFPADVLPAGIQPFLSMAVDTLEVGFVPAGTGATSVLFTLSSQIGWDIVPQKIAIEGLSVTVRIDRRAGSEAAVSFSALAKGTFRLGGEFDVLVPISGLGIRSLTIVPRGNLLPALEDLSAHLGGEELKNAVAAARTRLELEDLSIRGIELGFDLAARKWRDASITCDIKVADTAFGARVRLPGFRVSAWLKPGSRIDLAALAKRFFHDAELPALTLSDLRFSADARDDHFFSTDASTDWTVPLPAGKSFVLRGVSLRLRMRDGELTGFLGARAEVGGIEVALSGSKASAADGWEVAGTASSAAGIPLDGVLEDIAKSFGALSAPAALRGFLIRSLSVSFNTQTKNFSFACEGTWGESGGKALCLLVRLAKTGESFDKTFHLQVGERVFDLRAGAGAGEAAGLLAASYRKEGGEVFVLRELVSEVAPEAAHAVPASLAVTVRDAFLMYAGQGRLIAGLDLGLGVDLSQIPLAGSALPRGEAGIDKLRVLFASKAFTKEETARLSALVPDLAPLPQADLGAGPSFSAEAKLGGKLLPLSLGLGAAQDGPRNALAPAAGDPHPGPPSAAGEPHGKWFDVGKSLGPFHLARIGIGYEEGKVRFSLDAAFSTGGLTFSLAGLSVGSGLAKFEPEFSLSGLGLAYSNPPVEIKGALLRRENAEHQVEYLGTATISTAKLSLAALGAYTERDNKPCLFVYAVLDYPLGGPAFFFVTGAAAGFGYNQSVAVPAIEKVRDFPLITTVMGSGGQGSGADAMKDPLAALEGLRACLAPRPGQSFLAVGVRFTSFKLIDSFALLVLRFGDKFALDLLGVSRFQLPSRFSKAAESKPALAVVELMIKASFAPADGTLEVRGLLTEASHLFAPECRLQGGFAFCVWFGSHPHAGDFVFTLGGYHPHFNPPAHYPVVPRIGFNWPVTAELSAKGDMYFAITPVAVMGGGHLDVLFQSGELRAWFKAGADFLLAWEPYHYEARLYVSVGASYRLKFLFIDETISAELGADLEIWGPEFAGKAHVSWFVISFSITFGDQSARDKKPLGTWDEFATAFLPQEKERLSIAVQSGLLRALSGAEAQEAEFVVNPSRFRLAVHSVVPTRSAQDLYLAPLDLKLADSSHAVRIERKTDQGAWLPLKIGPDGEFLQTPVCGRVPAALWGNAFEPGAGSASLVEAQVGFELAPAPKAAPADAETASRAELAAAAGAAQKTTGWAVRSRFAAGSKRWREAARGGSAARLELAGALGLGVPGFAGEDEGFAAEPVVVRRTA